MQSVPEPSVAIDTYVERHTVERDGLVYDVNRLISLTSHLPITEVSIGFLRASIENICAWEDTEGEEFYPAALLVEYNDYGSWDAVAKHIPELHVHVSQIKNADCSYPVLIYDNHVVDGMHRIVRACSEKKQFLPARILDELPEKAILTPKWFRPIRKLLFR